jgi:hypothetical protein
MIGPLLLAVSWLLLRLQGRSLSALGFDVRVRAPWSSWPASRSRRW